MGMSSLFGGVDQMKRQLVAAIREKRRVDDITQERLDQLCGFGAVGVVGAKRLPTTAQFEADHRKMTSEVFSAASFALDLNIDEVFEIDIDDKRLCAVVEEMKRNRDGVIALTGTNAPGDVPPETQAPVYAILKALDEMDEAPSEDARD